MNHEWRQETYGRVGEEQNSNNNNNNNSTNVPEDDGYQIVVI